MRYRARDASHSASSSASGVVIPQLTTPPLRAWARKPLFRPAPIFLAGRPQTPASCRRARLFPLGRLEASQPSPGRHDPHHDCAEPNCQGRHEPDRRDPLLVFRDFSPETRIPGGSADAQGISRHPGTGVWCFGTSVPKPESWGAQRTPRESRVTRAPACGVSGLQSRNQNPGGFSGRPGNLASPGHRHDVQKHLVASIVPAEAGEFPVYRAIRQSPADGIGVDVVRDLLQLAIGHYG